MDNKIYLPKPCSEKWDNMTPVERGKLCEICNRKVYDLTKMNNTEIISLINSEERVCGKIAITQLNKRPYSLHNSEVGTLVMVLVRYCPQITKVYGFWNHDIIIDKSP
jgi:hypothetical protein